MKRSDKKIQNIITRYLILIATAFPNFYIFYLIFTPLTIYSSYFLLDLFFDANLFGNVISISGCFPIEIVEACVAGSAYYLLFFLNLSTPKIKIKKRIQMLSFAFSVLFLVNILRIFFLSILFIYQSKYFDITHNIFWYFVSIILVIGIWFWEIKIFKIKEIPVYSDLKFLKKQIK